MTFNALGLRLISSGGTIADAVDPSGSITANIFHYITNDAEAAIETDGYFDAGAEYFTKGGADVLWVSADRDGTPAGLAYVVVRNAGDIALTPFKGTT